MDGFISAASLLPVRLREKLLSASEETKRSTEEIRLRCGQAVSLLIRSREHIPYPELSVSRDELQSVLETACASSVHSFEAQMSRGSICAPGGIRVGVCGQAVMKNGCVAGLRSLSSAAIRIPHELIGCGAGAFDTVFADGVSDLLILSPPGGGKTSLLREYVRRLSTAGVRVSLADDRGEVAGTYMGRAQFDLGTCTDVISGAPKADAAMMLIRSMAPQVLAMDEISSPEDIRAVKEAAGCGVRILATAHAKSTADLRLRPVYRELLSLGVFRYAIIIECDGSERSYRPEELRA